MNTVEPLINRRTWRIVIILLVVLVLVMVALWVIRYARSSFGGTGKGSPGTNPDGTPTYIPPSVDQSYIDRISLMVYEVNKEEDYSAGQTHQK